MKYTKEYLRDNNIAIKFLSNGDYNFLDKFYEIGINLTMNQAIICYERNGTWSWDDDITAFDGYTIIDSDVIISEIKKPDNRKLLGYKYPFKTYNGIQVKDNLISVNGNRCVLNLGVEYYIALEIVEQWEPVYGEEKPTFGSFADIIKHFKGDTDKLILLSILSGHLQVCFNEEEVGIKKENFNFTNSFQKELTKLGIKI